MKRPFLAMALVVGLVSAIHAKPIQVPEEDQAFWRKFRKCLGQAIMEATSVLKGQMLALVNERFFGSPVEESTFMIESTLIDNVYVNGVLVGLPPLGYKVRSTGLYWISLVDEIADQSHSSETEIYYVDRPFGEMTVKFNVSITSEDLKAHLIRERLESYRGEGTKSLREVQEDVLRSMDERFTEWRNCIEGLEAQDLFSRCAFAQRVRYIKDSMKQPGK